MQITSIQNQKIKYIQKLDKNSFRRDENVFIIEGYREIRLAIEGKYEIIQIYHCPQIKSKNPVEELLNLNCEIFELSHEVFSKIAYRENSDGVLALARTKNHSLEDLIIPENPVILVVESIEKPGNLGAILRSCDAAGIDALIVCDERTDIYNPNTIRSGIGCLFTVQLATATSTETLKFLTSKNIKSYAAALTANEFYQDMNYQEPTAIIMGTESTGLSDFWLKNASSQIKIPMSGKIDSLNVSTSAAILVFEAMRQRNFRKI